VVGSNQSEPRQSAEIGRSAWSAIVSTLARFEIIQVQLAGARSESVAELPPYEPDIKTNPFWSGSQSRSHDQLQPHQSLTDRLARLFSGSTRGRRPT